MTHFIFPHTEWPRKLIFAWSYFLLDELHFLASSFISSTSACCLIPSSFCVLRIKNFRAIYWWRPMHLSKWFIRTVLVANVNGTVEYRHWFDFLRIEPPMTKRPLWAIYVCMCLSNTHRDMLGNGSRCDSAEKDFNGSLCRFWLLYFEIYLEQLSMYGNWLQYKYW